MEGKASYYDYDGHGDDYSRKQDLLLDVGRRIPWPKDELAEYKKQMYETEGFDVYRFPNSLYYGRVIPDRYLFPNGIHLKISTFIAKRAIQDYNLRLNHVDTAPYKLVKIVMSNYAYRGRDYDFYITFEVVSLDSHYEYDDSHSEYDIVRKVYPETFQARGIYGINNAVTVCFCRPQPIQRPSTSVFRGLPIDPYTEMCKPSGIVFDEIPDNQLVDGVITPVENPHLSFFESISELSVDYYNKDKKTDCKFFKFLNANERNDGSSDDDDSENKIFFIKFMVVHTYAGFRTLEAMVGCGLNQVPYVKMCRVKPIEPAWMEQVPKVYEIISPFDRNYDSI